MCVKCSKNAKKFLITQADKISDENFQLQRNVRNQQFAKIVTEECSPSILIFMPHAKTTIVPLDTHPGTLLVRQGKKVRPPPGT